MRRFRELKRRGINKDISPETFLQDEDDEGPTELPQHGAETGRKQRRWDISSFLKTFSKAFLYSAVVGLGYFMPFYIPEKFIENGAASKSQAAAPVARNKAPIHRDILSNTTSFCLLTKDDNEILNEWIAYHYHVLNMRQLIVAIDPSSTESPASLLKKWEDLFGMSIDIWNDEDFMPDFFLQGNYDEVESYVYSFQPQNGIDNTSMAYVEQLTTINNHRFRQHTFVSACLRRVKERLKHPEARHWVAHVDSDEFISVNPVVTEKATKLEPIAVPKEPSAGSLLFLLNDYYRHNPNEGVLRRCLTMPRILYLPQSHHRNSTDSIHSTIWDIWDTERFETLRWHVHRNLSEPSGYPKSMVDVAAIPMYNPTFEENRVYSVHYLLKPSHRDCLRPNVHPNFRRVYVFPLVVNHYFGSLERYMSRNDTRRHESIWEKKSQLNGTLADGWVLQWLPSFVASHGLDLVSEVLGAYQKGVLP
eukprot:scaffold4973_cov135-Cylindrotheca_fusiformis.AAC.7